MTNTPEEVKQPIEHRGKPLPEGVTLRMLQENWDRCKTVYSKIRQRIIKLDAADKGRSWELICKKFPQYQIAPDSNYVNYVKENLLASIYTVGKAPHIIPKSPEDEGITKPINQVLDSIWDILSVPMYQQKAGERAALTNYGVTQVGWNKDLIGGTKGAWYKGDVVFKNIDPLNFFRDPFSETLDDAVYCIHHDKHHMTNLKANVNYAEELSNYKFAQDIGANEELISYKDDRTGKSSVDDKYVRLVIHWVKVAKKGGGYKIHEIHTLNNEWVLFVKEDIKPSMFPFAELYCNEPGNDLIGTSEPWKIFQSAQVLNILDGLIATHAYKAQRPPRLISGTSGLNLRVFAKYGNDPDKAFIVNGIAKDAVQYIQFPPLPPEIMQMVERLDRQIKTMSGIDERYTGKDTGSILTTGGIEAMLAQATMRDTTKINNYEAYAKRLGRLVIMYLIKFADKRAYSVKNVSAPGFHSVEIDFPSVPDEIQFQFGLHISNHLPKTKMRMAQAADAIMQQSMQYADPTGQTPPLMEPEEWLEFQDFPQKDIILARMKLQRESSTMQDVMMALTGFADLIKQGVPPEDAIELVVQKMEEMKNPQNAVMQEGGLSDVSADTGGFGGQIPGQ